MANTPPDTFTLPAAKLYYEHRWTAAVGIGLQGLLNPRAPASTKGNFDSALPDPSGAGPRLATESVCNEYN